MDSWEEEDPDAGVIKWEILVGVKAKAQEDATDHKKEPTAPPPAQEEKVKAEQEKEHCWDDGPSGPAVDQVPEGKGDQGRR